MSIIKQGSNIGAIYKGSTEIAALNKGSANIYQASSSITLDVVNNTLLRLSGGESEDTSYTIKSNGTTLGTVSKNAGVQDLRGCEWTNSGNSSAFGLYFNSKLLYKTSATGIWAAATNIVWSRSWKYVTSDYRSYYYSTVTLYATDGTTLTLYSSTNSYTGYNAKGTYPTPAKQRDIWLKWYDEDSGQYTSVSDLRNVTQISFISSLYSYGTLTMPAPYVGYYDLSSLSSLTAGSTYQLSAVGSSGSESNTLSYTVPATLTKTITSGSWETDWSTCYYQRYAVSVPCNSNTVLLKFTPTSTAHCPDSITVTGCSYTYDSTNGTITLWGATGSAVTVDVACPATEFPITVTAQHCTVNGPSSSTYNTAATFTVVPDEGYCLPRTVYRDTSLPSNVYESYIYSGGSYYDSATFNTDNLAAGILTFTRGSTNTTQIRIVCHKLVPLTINNTRCTYSLNQNGVSDDSYGVETLITFTPDTGYALPGKSAVQVESDTTQSWSYDPETGVLSICTNAHTAGGTGVTVTINAVVPNNVTTNCTNGTITGPSAIAQGLTGTYQITATDSFSLPDAVTVTGTTEYEYDSGTGVVTLTSQGSDMSITAECIGAASFIVESTKLNGAALTTPRYGTEYVSEMSSASHTYQFTTAVTNYAVASDGGSEYYEPDVTVEVASDGLSAVVTVHDTGDNFSLEDCSSTITVTFYASAGSESDTFEARWSHFMCYIKGTLITLANGKTKPVEDITYDDELLVWSFDNAEFWYAKPLWIMKAHQSPMYNKLTFSDGSVLCTINQHRIFNVEKGKFTYPMTEDTPVGTHTMNDKGEIVELVNKEIVYERVEYYNIITNYYMNCFASGILTSCRASNLYPIVDLRYQEDADRVCQSYSAFDCPIEFYNGLRLGEQPAWSDASGIDLGFHSWSGFVRHLISIQKPR